MKLYGSTAGNCAEESAQGIVDHVIRFGQPHTKAVLAVLDADANQRENAGYQHHFQDFSPLFWQCFIAQKAGGVEENCVHKIGSINFFVAAVEGGVVGGKGLQNGLR